MDSSQQGSLQPYGQIVMTEEWLADSLTTWLQEAIKAPLSADGMTIKLRSARVPKVTFHESDVVQITLDMQLDLHASRMRAQAEGQWILDVRIEEDAGRPLPRVVAITHESRPKTKVAYGLVKAGIPSLLLRKSYPKIRDVLNAKIKQNLPDLIAQGWKKLPVDRIHRELKPFDLSLAQRPSSVTWWQERIAEGMSMRLWLDWAMHSAAQSREEAPAIQWRRQKIEAHEATISIKYDVALRIANRFAPSSFDVQIKRLSQAGDSSDLRVSAKAKYMLPVQMDGRLSLKELQLHLDQVSLRSANNLSDIILGIARPKIHAVLDDIMDEANRRLLRSAHSMIEALRRQMMKQGELILTAHPPYPVNMICDKNHIRVTWSLSVDDRLVLRRWKSGLSD